MIINKDLRELNEDEFKEVYEYIKQRTNNFTCLNKDILDENPQYLLVVRFALGLSQLEFSKLLGTTNKQWVRHFEAGRQGFKNSEMYEKALELINKLFSEDKIVDYERTLLSWNKCRAARSKFFLKPREEKYFIKRLNDMTIEDFRQYFNYLKQETNNFTKFDTNIVFTTPEFITILRIILDISHRSLAKILNIMPRTVRTNESRLYNMTPEKCKLYIKTFENLFKEKGIIGNVNLEQSIENFKRISSYDNFEEEIIEILERNNIKVFNGEEIKNYNNYARLHAILRFGERELNFDFLIFKDGNPIAIIEATKLFGVKREINIRARVRYRISYVDHRFQMIKKYYSNVITLMSIKCHKDQEDLVKRFLEVETLNTDFYFVNNINFLGDKIKELIEN